MEKTPETRIPLDKCVKGRLYEIRCRNLSLGVYDGEEGFIGLRLKFGDRFLFTEYHWDQGPPYGTVKGVKDTGIDIPEGMVAAESLGDVDSKDRRPILWVRGIYGEDKALLTEGYWTFEDTGERFETTPGHHAMRLRNKPLFSWLELKERELTGDSPSD